MCDYIGSSYNTNFFSFLADDEMASRQKMF